MTLAVSRLIRPLAALAALLVLSAATPKAYAAATVREVVSPGGITAWLVSDDTVPLISVDFAFRGGATQDPDNKPGVASMLSTLFDEGAGDLDSAAFQSRLEETAVRLSFDADRDSFQGSMGTLSNRKDAAFNLLALALTKPRFDEEPIGRMRARLISNLRSGENDPETIASRLFAQATFPNHPYGRPVEGTPETLATITRADILAFYEANIARDNLVIGVVGDITVEELGPLLDRAFGGLPAKAKLKPVPDVTPKAGLTLSGTLPNPQTIIRLGAPGIVRSDPDFIPAFVMNTILGGGTFSSRLYAEIREKRGLAYSVWSAIAPYDRAGLILAGTSTQAAKAGESIAIMKAEIARMAANGPTEKELADTKTYLTGNYALRFDSSGKISAQLVSLQLDRLPIDYFQNRNALVEAVTLADVKRVSKRLLDQPFTIVTVGPS
jgi:zinc protease